MPPHTSRYACDALFPGGQAIIRAFASGAASTCAICNVENGLEMEKSLSIKGFVASIEVTY
jgi:hypothetical protein